MGVQLIATLQRTKTIETEKRNEKGETKNSEIIEDCNKIMLGVVGAEQILHYFPRCRITMKWAKKFVFFMLQLSTLHMFIFWRNYTTN